MRLLYILALYLFIIGSFSEFNFAGMNWTPDYSCHMLKVFHLLRWTAVLKFLYYNNIMLNLMNIT